MFDDLSIDTANTSGVIMTIREAGTTGVYSSSEL